MKFKISGKNIDLTDELRERVMKKIGKLDKFFSSETEASVMMSIQKSRHIIEVTIPYNGMFFRAEVTTDDMFASIDKSVDIIERQIRKNKTRLEKKMLSGSIRTDYVDGDIYVDEEKEFRIERRKKFNTKPMTTEEAILQMNLIGHEFFVFVNSDTKDVNVVYKRKDGNYGIIEP